MATKTIHVVVVREGVEYMQYIDHLIASYSEEKRDLAERQLQICQSMISAGKANMISEDFEPRPYYGISVRIEEVNHYD